MKAEEALRESEARLRIAQQAAGVGIWDWDIRAGTISWDSQMYAIFGLDPEKDSASFATWNSILHPEDLKKANLLIETALREQTDLASEYRIIRRDGEVRWINALGQGIYHGEIPIRMTGICMDITERKQSEKELESIARFPAENPNPILRIDGICRIRYSNDAAQRMMAGSGGQGGVLPERFVQICRDVLTSGKRQETEFTDGTKTYLLTFVPFIEHGYVNVYGRDITERQQAEKALKEYAENLKRSNEDLERFAYIASHDLQEPLRNVVSFSQLLSRRYTGKLDPDADEFIGYIVEGGKRMQALVSDLLEYSRVNTRAEPFRLIDSEQILDKVMQNLFFAIQENNAVIETGSLPTISADPEQLRMVFQNLIANAIKFKREEPPYIHISAEKNDQMWKFSVRDNGIGIDPAFHDRIFEIFQRLHTRDKYPGTGVGLAIVKKIIERHGGRIWVESEVGKGSTFYFTLPGVS
jgi:PAS domain S-box-containing protein